jgi:hypothetical protein
MRQAGRRGPADPRLAGAQDEGGRAEAQRAQPALSAADEIAPLRADTSEASPQGCRAREEIVPEAVQGGLSWPVSKWRRKAWT